jgi:hypothetical protein
MKNTKKQELVQFIIALNRSAFTLIHIIGIYSLRKPAKYYIAYRTINFLNLK